MLHSPMALLQPLQEQLQVYKLLSGIAHFLLMKGKPNHKI